MKVKIYIFVILFSVIFAGCGGPYLHTGLSDNVAKEYPLVMVTNDNIVCADHIFKKGAKFGVYDASNGKYMNLTNRFGEKKNFPDKALYINANEDLLSGGVLVYPNGKFVYEGGGLVLAVAINRDIDGNDKVILWGLNPEVICKFNSDTPFTKKRNN